MSNAIKRIQDLEDRIVRLEKYRDLAESGGENVDEINDRIGVYEALVRESMFALPVDDLISYLGSKA